MTETRPTPTIEDYLGILYVMERDGEPIIAARLAEMLEVSPPTVTMTLKRMARDGWIELDEHKGIHLTPNGHQAASSLIRRHMLIEWMLARLLKVPWAKIHAEAHQIEHTISEDVEARLQSSLEDPQLCPHGNPLPGFEHMVESWLPLTGIAAGETVTIRRIHEIAEDNLQVIRFLDQNSIFPGVQAQVTEVLPFNQTITLSVNQRQVTVGMQVARYLFVERMSN